MVTMKRDDPWDERAFPPATCTGREPELGDAKASLYMSMRDLAQQSYWYLR